jgi:hypothetical protein
MPSGSIDPIKAANRIGEFSNSSLGRAIFSPEELDAFKAHAQGVRDLDATLANLASTKTAQTSAADFSRLFSGEGIGGGQATAFRKIVEGTATPEETAHAIFGAIGSGGNPGNISRLITSIKRISGDESDAMSAIRQGVWQRLTQDADDFSKRVKMADAIRGFVHGRGMTIANQLFDMHERDLMLRYADAARTGANPRGLSRLSRTIINMVGHKLGVPHAGHAVDWMLKASRQQ